MQHSDKLFSQIQMIDTLNEQQPHPTLKFKLGHLRLELRTLLLEKFKKVQKRSRMTFYATGNKAGKFLAKQVKDH